MYRVGCQLMLSGCCLMLLSGRCVSQVTKLSTALEQSSAELNEAREALREAQVAIQVGHMHDSSLTHFGRS